MGTIYMLRLPQVIARTGLSRSTIYSKKATGDFPQNVRLGPRAVGWRSDDIDRWILKCIDDSAQGDD